MVRILMMAPLLALPILIYALVAITAGADGTFARLQSVLFGMPMLSGDRWIFSLGDFLLLTGLITLFLVLVFTRSDVETALLRAPGSLFQRMAAPDDNGSAPSRAASDVAIQQDRVDQLTWARSEFLGGATHDLAEDHAGIATGSQQGCPG